MLILLLFSGPYW